MNKSITTHTLRHTPISTISQMGIPLKAIMDHVGHIDHKTTYMCIHMKLKIWNRIYLKN
ncbi:hypothetical protein [Macrococcoides caseolyticum]|uniref:hypothetical protein n=1 Tax=Macrococcoides caseolyticum TaxID=69966 RepID=UPI0039C95B29